MTERLRDPRIVIVGTGAVGSAIAYRLSEAGATVTVVDRSGPGTGTSGASFAWTNAFDKPPREYHDLSTLGMREHRTLAAELAGDWLHVDGALHWIDEGDPERVERFLAGVRRDREWGYEIEEIAPAVVMRELEPGLRLDTSRVTRVWRVAAEGWIDAPRLCDRLVAAAQGHGATVIRGIVAALERVGGRVTGAHLADGTRLPADVIVNAAGPDGQLVAALAGAELTVRREPGFVVRTSAVHTPLRHVIWADVEIRPDGGGRLALHQGALDRLVADETGDRHAEVAQLTLRAARAMFPALAEATIESARLGVRPIPPDRRPIVGWDPDIAGLYHAVMHSGITLCAGIARLVTNEIAGQHVAELARFRPDRFRATAAASR